jgi:hypothetical protein
MNIPSRTENLVHRLRWVLALLAGLVLTACDSVSTETTPNTNDANRVVEYTGLSCGSGFSDAESAADACAFKVEFWDKMPSVSQCDNCHDSQTGSQSPFFMESSDVNQAYSQILSIVNRADPAGSRLLTKISGGHNCGDAAACAALTTIVGGYLNNWFSDGSRGGGVSNKIVLETPISKDAGASKSFPNAPIGFTGVHDLLTTNCAGCHAESSITPQSPFFAESDIDAAYDAIVTSQKINLDDPASSRLVVRLRQEFHNCWDPDSTGSTDCARSAEVMESAITDFANGITLSSVDTDWVISKALSLPDGQVASGGARDDSNTIALYEFKSGEGSIVFDTSGVEPSLNLDIYGTEDIDYRWVGGWGIEFMTADGKAQGTTQVSKKLRDRIVATGEYSIEAWVVPANVTQGDDGAARIISYSAGTGERNFTLGQVEYRYEAMNRSADTDANGEPSLITDDMDEDLQATQQHVVLTYDPVNGRRLYVNGVDVATIGNDAGSTDPVAPGSLSGWDDSFAFILGNEASNDRPWAGRLRLVAIHNRAMTQSQISQNFEAGVGEKLFLLFGLGDLPGVPSQSYIMFTVSQFDRYSYLFDRPTFVNLDSRATAPATDLVVRGMRIGLNGDEPAVGQAYRNLDTTIASTSYNTAGQILSDMGTIIELKKGPETDEFFLTFEQIGSNTDVRTVDVCGSNITCTTTPQDGDPTSDIGLRTFGEINASMAALTGINATNTDVKNVFITIRQQLPTTADINTFLSAHEIGVAQLAIEYCSVLVDDTGARAGFFPGFDFSADANGIPDADWTNLVIQPLMNRFMGTGLNTQPDTAAVQAELLTLITNPADVRLDNSGSTDGIPDGLAKCGGACSAGRAELVVKSACAALLGSAVSLVQ